MWLCKSLRAVSTPICSERCMCHHGPPSGNTKELWKLSGVSEEAKRQGLGDKNIVLHSFIYRIYADVLCTILSSIEES